MFFFLYVCFVFEKISSSLPILLVMLFAHVAKLYNNHSQVFFKIGVLKILQYSLKNTCTGGTF